MAEASGAGGTGDIGDGEEVRTTAARPPVTGEHEWRARALAAEDALSRSQEELKQLRQQFDEHKAQIAANERRRQINAAAQQAAALDNELVAMLVEAQLTQAPDLDVTRFVADLKRDKPFLFAGAETDAARAARQTPTAAGAAIGTGTGPSEAIVRKAEEARATGDRRALLGYLRARRGA